MTIWIIGMIAVLIGFDQLFKYLAIVYLQPEGSVPIIDQVFHLTSVENLGAAGGILQGKQLFLILVTSAVIIGILVFLFLGKIPGKFLPWMAGMVVAGGAGNLIDRIFRGFVVDYLDFCWIHYPVFNFADCCVVVGVLPLQSGSFGAKSKRRRNRFLPRRKNRDFW